MSFDSQQIAALISGEPMADTAKAHSQSIRKLSDECAMECKFQTEEAAQMLLRRLQLAHASIYAERQRLAMLAWARDEIARSAQELRSKLSKPQSARPLSAESLKDFAKSWFDWPVRPGIQLRDATKATLEEAANVYLRDATIYSARGRWLAAIAKALPNARAKVADVLDEKTIAKMAVACEVTKELGEAP